ncbi:MAG TPA: peroxiredoxin [Candidatus Paceibacterota bacterium]|jgi:peroxiredoxin (alkyl hydroperoxide reductase subunit C)
MDIKGQKSNYCEYCGDFHEQLHEFSVAVRVGEPIPDYEFEILHDSNVRTAKFSDYKGKWLVVMFYPADFSIVCPTELEDMAGVYSDLKETGAEVISFSSDTVYAHRAWKDASSAIAKIPFPMGSDPSGKIASAFGVLVEGGELPYTSEEGLSLRGTFIVDPKGVLRTMEVHDNGIGRSAAETLRKVYAAQFVDTHPGQTCPANWEPGKKNAQA